MIRPSLPRPRPSWEAVIGFVLFVVVMVVSGAVTMMTCVGGL